MPSGTFINDWERRIFNVANLAAPSTERLAFVSDITENVRMSGTVVVSLEVASDVPWGNVSASLVEVNTGDNGRVISGTSTVRQIPAHNGVGAFNVVRYNAPADAPSTGRQQWRAYRLLTSACASIQNPNTDIITDPAEIEKYGLPGPRGRTFIEAGATNFVPSYYYQSIIPEPGVSNVYTFMFEASDWEFRAGNQIAVMVYSTDYRHTWTPSNPPEVTIITGPNTFIDIPAISRFNQFDERSEYQKVVDLLEGLKPEYDNAGNNPAEIGAKLTSQLTDIIAGYDINFTPAVALWSVSDGGDDRYYMWDGREPLLAWSVIGIGPVTSIRIDAGVIETVARGATYKFGLNLNEGAIGDHIVWTVSDPSFALVDDEANIYILNKTGTVRLIATDLLSGLSHSITLRIAS